MGVSKKDDQSFYGEALKYERGEYGDRPMVTTIGSVPMDDEQKEEPACCRACRATRGATRHIDRRIVLPLPENGGRWA